MKIKISELSGVALDWAVAKCESTTPKNAGLMRRIQIFTGASVGLFRLPKSTLHSGAWYRPSTDWAQAGPIIDRERIATTPNGCLDEWHAKTQKYADAWQFGPTPLIAAMRCYVASKVGDEIEIPAELI